MTLSVIIPATYVVQATERSEVACGDVIEVVNKDWSIISTSK